MRTMPFPPPAREAAPGGSLTFTANDAAIRITGHGFFSEACVDRHFEQLRRVVASARPACEAFRVLIDIRDAAVQTPQTSARIKAEARAIWTDADRIAVVVRAGLIRMQATRIIDAKNQRMFESEDDARRWLDAAPTPDPRR